MERIFISYKRADGEKVYKLIDKIEKTLGVKCWYDLDGIETAVQFMSKICNAIDNAEVVLFMHSSAHLGINYDNDWTVKELNYAHMTKKRVVLVKLDDAPLKNLFLMEYGTRNNIDSRRPDQWEKLMKDLGRWLSPSDSKPKVYSDAELKDLYKKGDEFYYKKLYLEAVECYRKAAEQGYAAAQNDLGVMYRYGYGVTKDYGEALRWFRKAVEQGYATAQNNLGYMYQRGYGVTEDYGEAVRWYRKAAEQGYAAAQYNLGDMYQYGYGVEKDLTQARYWYQKAADQGDEDAKKALARWLIPSGSKPKVYSDAKLKDLHIKGDEFYNKKLYPEAVECYRKAAEQGYAAAQYGLGVMYQIGYGVTKDYGEAVRWYRKAAEQGYAAAQKDLGTMYQYGYGVTKDYGEAVRWYRKAAEQGNAFAQNSLGYMYRNGYGVEKDLAQARYWYQKAADQGDEVAKMALARL